MSLAYPWPDSEDGSELKRFSQDFCRSRKDLADPRLTYANNTADFSKVQLFDIVERNDELLSLWKTVNRLFKRFHELRIFNQHVGPHAVVGGNIFYRIR